MEYFTTQKRYRCYNPTTHRYLVSNVTYSESTLIFYCSSPTNLLLVDIVRTESVVSVPTTIIDCPLQVYTRRPKKARSTVMPAPSSSLPEGSWPIDLDISIVLRRGKRSSTAHPIFNFVSYDRLHPFFCQFALSISSESIPKNYEEAILHPQWKATMDGKKQALISRDTWTLVPRPTDSFMIGCWWVYTIKYKPNRSVDRYKVRLIACGFT